MSYSWPGNVRELENAIERAGVLTNHEILSPADLRNEPRPTPNTQESGEWGVGSGTLREVSERAEREAIVAALKATDGNRREAAKGLGVSLRTLFYKIDRYRIE